MHTFFRFCASFVKALWILFVMCSVGILLGLATGQWELFIGLFLFSAVFFAPAAFYNTWDDFGD